MSERAPLRPHHALLAAACALVPRAAQAQPVTLAWEAPATCPRLDAVIARLSAPRRGGRPLTARARVTRDDVTERWRVRLETDDGSLRGERELTADTCPELVDAIVLILTLTLDAQPADTPPSPPLQPPTPASPPTPPSPPPPSPAPSRPADRARLDARLQAGVDLGRLPSPAAMISLGVGLRRGRWRVELVAAGLASQRVTLASGAGADLDAFSAGARVCFVPYARRFEVRGCGGIDVGVMRGEGFGVTVPASGSSPWLGAALGVALAWRPWTRLALVSALDATATLDRPTFLIRGVGEVHTPSRVGLVAHAGAEVVW